MKPHRFPRRIGALAITSATALVLTGGPAAGAVRMDCGNCIDGVDDSGAPIHWFAFNGTFWMVNPHRYAADGTCGQWHATCGEREDRQDLSALADAMPEMDGTELSRLVKEHPGQLFYNRERHAVQVLGCNAEVV